MPLGLANGEGLSKKALKTRVLHMWSGARVSSVGARLEDVVEYLEVRAGETCGKNLSNDLLVRL